MSRDEGYSPVDGTPGEREHMLATEAQPPPIVYGNVAVEANKVRRV